MSVQVQTLYTDVTRTLLEDSGFTTLSIMGDQDFFNFLKDTLQDFMSRTGCIKKLFSIPSHFNQGVYQEPDQAMDVQVANYDNAFLSRSSGWYLDNYDPFWNTAVGTVERWHQDDLTPKQISIDPAPTTEGHQVLTIPGNDGYGQISAVTAADFTVVGPAAGGYGAIAGTNGFLSTTTTPSVYVDPLNAGYGTIATMVESNTNITLIATAQPTSYPQTKLDYFQLIPDSFTVYLKYGVLWKIFTGDTEYKDAQRGSYCRARYQEGINLVGAIMSEMRME